MTAAKIATIAGEAGRLRTGRHCSGRSGGDFTGKQGRREPRRDGWVSDAYLCANPSHTRVLFAARLASGRRWGTLVDACA
jgi:hypothetical protein